MVGPTRTPSTAASDTQPPRPSNAWILYRSAMCKKHQGRAQGDISKSLSEQWHNETAEVRAFYEALADEKKAEHARKYPEYRFRPMGAEEKRAMKEEKERAQREKMAARQERERVKLENKLAREAAGAPRRSAASVPGPSRSSMPPHAPYSQQQLQTQSSRGSPYDASYPYSVHASPPPVSVSGPSTWSPNAYSAYAPSQDYSSSSNAGPIPHTTTRDMYIPQPANAAAAAETENDIDWGFLSQPAPSVVFNFDAYYDAPSMGQ
ncbi:HMG-box DNA-binding protein [Mycena kentingensis (nom. inval.)]|nr:HMG-box DNA-binding protein [Mycena kentingensis (nom. inval.)]